MNTCYVSKSFTSHKFNDPALITLAQHIIASMTGNPRFATPDPTLAIVLAALTAFIAATAKAIDGTKQDTADKNAKREILEDLLRKLAEYVQRTSGGVEVSILSSGFDVHKKKEPVGALPTPENFQIQVARNKGAVQLSCDAVPKAEFYEFEFTESPVTPASIWWKKTCTKKQLLIEGLKSGKEYTFRVAAASSDPSSQWTPEVSSFVL